MSEARVFQTSVVVREPYISYNLGIARSRYLCGSSVNLDSEKSADRSFRCQLSDVRYIGPCTALSIVQRTVS